MPRSQQAQGQNPQGPGSPAPEAQAPQGSGGDVQALVKRAIQLLYGDNFEAMVQMFQKHGKAGFPQAMAMAVNGVLDRLEKDQGGPLDAETAAQVGVAVFEALLQDLSEGGVLPDIDKDSVLQSLEAILRLWTKNHPDQADPEQMKSVIQQLAQQMSQEGALEDGQIMTPSERAAAGQQAPGTAQAQPQAPTQGV